MNERIKQKVKIYMGKYHMIAPGDTVVAGVSGGADSVCLFLILYELSEEMGFRLIAVHVNHGIREEAGEDASYVKKLCEERGIPFVLVEKDVRAYASREKLSEEEAGRKVRYQAFEDALAEYGKSMQDGGREASAFGGKIAVAHNANDRAETMLFHFFRGTGLSGASGIKPVRDNVIRPILCLKREEIEEYLGEKGISFCIDRTNMEDTYTRNRIRNHILPYAEKEICSGAVSHMCEAADMLLETEVYIRKQAEAAYERCVQTEEERQIVWNAESISQEDAFIRRQILLMGLEKLTEGRKDITSVHVKQIEGLFNKQGCKQISLPYGLTARKEYERLLLTAKSEKDIFSQRDNCGAGIPIEVSEETEILGEVEVPGLGRVEFCLFSEENIPPDIEKEGKFFGKNQIIPPKSCTKWFDYDRITRSLMFRTRETGDYLTINEKYSKKSLKDYMIGEKIPRIQRGKLYVLAEGSHILWVPGHRISEYYKVTKQTKRILQVQLRGGL